ncbi:MAG: sugar phosphate nucleotidyltransferase [Candidatus Sumerlaeota bacterium]|nr:sugar phosphate nucleotidyltransferase [Candidatus Sumerlaeota bacterium]
MSHAPSDRKRFAVIMAGGAGERFWPLSRHKRPKQLLPLSSPHKTLLEEAVERIQPLIPPNCVYIATSRHLQPIIRKSLKLIPPENVLAEPCKRNTAGCLVYAAAHIMAQHGDSSRLSMAVLTADHLIPESNEFVRDVNAALEAAEREDALAVIGVPPARPHTGYGYIEIAEGARAFAHCAPDRPVYPVMRFREKPNRETAEDFIATGRFYWNSGMFFWPLSAFMRELDDAGGPHAQALREMTVAMRRGDDAITEKIFEELPNISIDYVLMERARRVIMALAHFSWDDVGSWDSLDRTHPHDAHGNVAIGNPVLVDTQNCIVYNDCGAKKMAVATIGVKDLAIIVTADGVLVVPKERAQDVRQAMTLLKERKAPQL